ncbi:MAG TPA: HAD hydrolase-like protein, partial [Candidatus Baltobacteraceae bacterium]|nr:HAD hydrolase-like protein [Candidatus Baltobacteraceae bacterium]
MTRHIVWDWNGTLINDVHAVVEATNSSLAPFDHPGLSIEEYRRRFRRPLRAFNEEILGIALTDEQWKGVCDRWSVDYRRRVPECNLYAHTIPALEAVRERGVTQSVLSMWQHHELCALVAKRELSPYFLQVQGSLVLESDHLKSR